MGLARVKSNVIFTLDRLPLVAIAGLAGFGVAAMGLLLAGQFQTWLVWPLGSLAAVVCAWPVLRLKEYQRPGSVKARVACDVLVLVGVVLWGGWSILYTSQHIVTDRDPATYGVTAGWLATRSGFTEKVPDTFAGMDWLTRKSAGFGERIDGDTTTLYPQGQHLLPALLGSVGKVVGPKHVLRFNVLFGMTSLLAIYCFARLFMRPQWGLLATGAVGASFPLLYLSRETYTEPLALTFTFGGLSLLWLAQQKKQLLLWALAGLVLGAGVLVRIDGYLVLVGIAAFFAVYLTLGGKKYGAERVKQTAVFWVPAALMAALAWLDLELYSRAYLQSSQRLISYEILALVVVLAAGCVASVTVRNHVNILTWLHRRTIRWRAWLAAIAVLVLGVFFASRPLWYEPLAKNSNGIVSSIQRLSGDKIEPRTYAELTTYWVSWYIGPLLAAFGLLGLVVASYKGMRDKTLLLLPALAVILGSCLVYFVAPNITPDQPWAARRMLPVILPGVAIFGAYALALAYEKMKVAPWVKAASAAVVSTLILAVPISVSSPILTVPLKAQYQIAGDACEALPKNSAVVLAGLARLTMVQPVRSFCGVETYNYAAGTDKPSKENLRKIAKKARENGKLPVLGVYRSQYGGLIDEAEWLHMSEMNRTRYIDIARTLTTVPTKTERVEEHLSLAVINNDGTLSPLPTN